MVERSKPVSPAVPAAVSHPAVYDRDAYVHEASVGLLLRRVTDSLRQQIDRRLAAHDLTHAQWMPLFKIAKGEAVTMVVLARDMCLDPGATTRALDRLEAKGLVRRERSQDDRRVVNLVATEAGQAVAAQVWGVLADVLNEHLAGFDRQEFDLLMSLLQRMLANGEAMRCAGSGAAEDQP